MKIKCGECAHTMEVPIQEQREPVLTGDNAYWWRFWLLMGPIMGLFFLSLIGWGIHNSWRDGRHVDAMLRESSIKVEVIEYPGGNQIRRFTR